ncbi:MAG TPA: FtsX-like permease family protein [Trebonia sp.]
MLTVALATVRARWTAFVGTFAAIAVGVSVIATMALVLAAASGGGPHQLPERFAAAPYVLQVSPNLQVRDRYGSVDSVPLPAQPDVPAPVVARLPDTIADRSFYAQVRDGSTAGRAGTAAPAAESGAAGAPAAGPDLGHGWSSAAFAPYVLASGHAPRMDDQIVIAGPAVVGRRVVVATAAGSRTYTIAGTVRPRTGEQPVFFTDAEAARLSPAVDVLVTSDAATAARAAALPGAHLEVLTGPARHEADPDAVADTTELTGLTTFLGVAALISAFAAVAVTATAFGLSVAQRRRDLALLRTIGATPRQVRRMVCAEAAVVGAGGSAAGCLLGLWGAPRLASWIVGQGLAPSWFSVGFTAGSVAALAIAFLAGVAVAVLSVLVAALRAGSIRPAEALREAVAEPQRAGWIRLLGGIAAVSWGAAALVAVAVIFPSGATDPKDEAEVVILLIGGTALLAPFLLRPLTWPFGRGTAGTLLRANALSGPKRSAAVIVPVLIAVSLTASLVGASTMASSAASAAERQQAAEAGFVVLPAAGTPGLSIALVDRIRSLSGVQATAVADTDMLAYETQLSPSSLDSPIPVPFPALGVDQPSAALDLKVIAGSLTSLNNQTIAVDSSWHEHVGDTVNLWRPDGTPVSLTVIAVVAPTLSGPTLIVNLHNAGAPRPDRVYVKTDPGASPAALLAAVRSQHARMIPVSGWSAAVTNQQAAQNQAGLELLIGIAVAYSLIGIAGTFLMSVGARRRELTLLRLAGALRRQVVWFVTAESLVLTLAGIVLSAALSALVLGGVDAALHAEAGSVPFVVPWGPVGAVIVGCAAIAALTSAGSAWSQLRRPAGGDSWGNS